MTYSILHNRKFGTQRSNTNQTRLRSIPPSYPLHSKCVFLHTKTFAHWIWIFNMWIHQLRTSWQDRSRDVRRSVSYSIDRGSSNCAALIYNTRRNISPKTSKRSFLHCYLFIGTRRAIYIRVTSVLWKKSGWWMLKKGFLAPLFARFVLHICVLQH